MENMTYLLVYEAVKDGSVIVGSVPLTGTLLSLEDIRETEKLLKENLGFNSVVIINMFQIANAETSCNGAEIHRQPEAIEALKEVQQYREIGTVEECREAIEKQKPHSVLCKEFNIWGTIVEIYKCPNCGEKIRDKTKKSKYCKKCGQAILWDENLEGR